MSYTVYILYSETTSGYYTGYSANISKRIKQHNDGLTPSTKGKGPWKIVYTEIYQNKRDALKRERFLKKQKNRDFYQKLISTFKKTNLSEIIRGVGSSAG